MEIRTCSRGDVERLNYAFRRCVARTPTAAESQALLDLLERQTRHFSRDGAKPWELIAADPAKPPPLPDGMTPARLAAWTMLSRVLLNLDETITRD